MTLTISQISNAALQRLAYMKDKNNDGFLQEDEFIKFKSEAANLKNISDEDFNQAMGLYISNPISKIEEPVMPSLDIKSDDSAKFNKEGDSIVLDGKEERIDSSKYYWDELIEMFYADSLDGNGGVHTMKEIRAQLKKVNNIPIELRWVPKGVIMPQDLFGDGNCVRTEQREIQRKKPVR